jgi:hypothetical protein
MVDVHQCDRRHGIASSPKVIEQPGVPIMTEISRSDTKATAGDAVEILGALPDERIAAILATGVTVRQLEEAAAWAAGESDVMGHMRRPVSGPVAAVYDILTANEAYAEDRD